MSEELSNEGGGNFDAAAMIDDQGGFTDEFRENVPSILGEGFEEFKGFDKYSSLPDLLKGAAHASKKLGEKTEGMVKFPGEEASEDEIKEYRKAIGVPDSAEDYEFTRRQLGQGQNFDKEGEAVFKTFAHERGWPAKTAQEAIEFFDRYEEQLITAMAEARIKADRQANNAFDKKHGENAEKIRRRVGEAMARTGFTDNVLDHLQERYKGIENDPVIIDWFNGHIIPKILPGRLHDSQGGRSKESSDLKDIYTHKTSKELLGS